MKAEQFSHGTDAAASNQSATSKAEAIARIRCINDTMCDEYRGKLADFLAGGLFDPDDGIGVRLDQLPGQPGRPKKFVRYSEGKMLLPYERRREDPDLVIELNGQTLRIQIDVSAEEKARRVREDAEQEAKQKAKEREAKAQELDDIISTKGPATFQVGDKCLTPLGYEVEITEGHRCHSVLYEGVDMERYGYIVRYTNGEQYFYRPADLTNLDGSPRHLRLVR